MNRPILKIVFLIFIFALGARAADAPHRTIKIAGFGALTGPVQSFGINSRAAQQAAAETINRNGGVRLADGAVANIEVSYSDDACNPDQAIALVRRIEQSSALVAIGPSCSSVAEPLFAALQHRVDDSADNGIRMPIITDGATKANLARISEWAFRNVADEQAMYRTLWQWVRRQHPDFKTVFGGEEGDFAHSHSTWQNIIRKTAMDSGFAVTGEAKWSFTDTHFSQAVANMKRAQPDVVVLSSHPTTTCGVLNEMKRQGVHPKLVVGLTSSASEDTLHGCSQLAEGLLIPTTFMPMTPAARTAAAAVNAKGGVADLHSMAAWENLMMVKEVLEREGILGTPDNLSADRRKLRDGLAKMTTFDGLLGTIERAPDRESHKPYVLVQVRNGRWQPVDQLVKPDIGASQHVAVIVFIVSYSLTFYLIKPSTF